ncbi:MAG: hypothetical protein AAFX56_19555 [Pseudomonadota bacterium]
MSDNDGWLERFDREHRELTLPGLYWVSAIFVVVGTVGALWLLPVPQEFYEISPLFNWGSAFLMTAAVYYFIISLSLAIGLLPFVVGLAAFQFWLSTSGYSAEYVSAALLLSGILGIWLGHRPGARVSAVARDLQYMIIAPAWMLSLVYRRIGIPV